MREPIGDVLRELREKRERGQYKPYRYTLAVYPPGGTSGGYWPSHPPENQWHRQEERLADLYDHPKD